MSKDIHPGWVVGAQVSAPRRGWRSGPSDWSPPRTVTKITSAGNVALDGGPVEYRIHGQHIFRRGGNRWSIEGYLLLTPERIAEREAEMAVYAREMRANAAINALNNVPKHEIPEGLIDAIEAFLHERAK